jgi:hypothetical protein
LIPGGVEVFSALEDILKEEEEEERKKKKNMASCIVC